MRYYGGYDLAVKKIVMIAEEGEEEWEWFIGYVPSIDTASNPAKSHHLHRSSLYLFSPR
jgi:hypothetical protein